MNDDSMNDDSMSSSELEVLSENADQFLNDLLLLEKIANQFGEDFSHLYAEICTLHEILTDKDLEHIEKKTIQLHSISGLVMLGRALETIQSIRNRYKREVNYTFSTEDRDSIHFLLNNIGRHYFLQVTLVSEFSYLSEKFIDGVKERLAFLLSSNFEDIKKRFKTVEYNKTKVKRSEMSIETIH